MVEDNSRDLKRGLFMQNAVKRPPERLPVRLKPVPAAKLTVKREFRVDFGYLQDERIVEIVNQVPGSLF